MTLFADATLASAFPARRCAGARIETARAGFQVREDEPEPRADVLGANSEAPELPDGVVVVI
jgi:hypothetical protein